MTLCQPGTGVAICATAPVSAGIAPIVSQIAVTVITPEFGMKNVAGNDQM